MIIKISSIIDYFIKIMYFVVIKRYVFKQYDH